MSPLPVAEKRPLVALGARRPSPGIPTSKELILALRRLGGEAPELVALFDARAIAGARHLLSAWAHLGRSRARGENRLRDRNAEFALFVAGDDQLPRALAKVGFTDETNQFVVVAEKPRDAASLVTSLGLVEDATAYPRPVDEALLDRLGIVAADRSVVAPEGWEGLVLERVALLELSSTHSPSKSTAKH
jgi:tRNA threonylcarbamoyladenosine modification (KEOPS) complex Cgi121 subunit